MNKIFEYIHYRIYMFFEIRDDNVPEYKGTLLLSLMQFLTLIDILFIVQFFYDYPFPNKYCFLPFLLALAFINWYKYERKFDATELKNKYKTESKRKWIRNRWFIGLYLLISMLIPIVYGVLKHNFKVI